MLILDLNDIEMIEMDFGKVLEILNPQCILIAKNKTDDSINEQLKYLKIKNFPYTQDALPIEQPVRNSTFITFTRKIEA